MDNKYFFQDENLIEAMMKSCLIYKSEIFKSNKKQNLFSKYVLSLIISDQVHNKNDIKKYFSEHHAGEIVDDTRIDNTLYELQKQNFIRKENEEILLTKNTIKNSNQNLQIILSKLDNLISDIFNKIRTVYSNQINSPLQVKENIKNCINFYFEVSSNSFFKLDDPKEIKKIKKIEELASFKLKPEEKNELKDIIIYAIGCIIEKPTKDQNETINFLAKSFISMQIMGLDPLLNNFKSTTIKDKVFLLDTDIIINAITENAFHSKQYRILLKKLIQCGCKLYIPEEIMYEVYNHAEAATKRYHYVCNFLDDEGEYVSKSLKNVFIEDFYFSKNAPTNDILWKKYIDNYFIEEYGPEYTFEQIKYRLGTKITYNLKIDSDKINADELLKLKNDIKEKSKHTEKAEHRDESENESIAKTDSKLYLYVKWLNESYNEITGNQNNKNKNKFLFNKTYFLTTSTRVHNCAKTLKLDSNVLCKPGVLLTYLSETGILNDNEVDIINFFDNPFLIQTSQQVSEDIEKIIKAGIDTRGKNMICLKYDLANELDKMLTSNSSDEVMETYENIEHKGYKFIKPVEDILNSKKKNEELEKENSELKEEIAKLKKRNRENEYKDRVNQKTLKNRKKKTK